jgi:hypothetical protein
MYKSFVVRSFRTFKELRVEGFQRVNLITGRNNVGKTALLEALFIHCGAANIHLPFSIENLRGVTQFQGGPEIALSSLFHEFDIRAPIELEGIDQLNIKRTCQLRVVPAPTVLPTTETETPTATTGQAIEITFVDPSRPEPLSARAVLEKGQLKLDPSPRAPLYQGFFLTPRGADHRSDAERFSKIAAIIGEEDRLVDAVRVIEPAIRAIRLLSHGGVSMLHVDVGLTRFLPLPYAGEGMVRLVAILIAIASAKNGVLFIDEFENGVHYTVLDKMWEATATFAERFNVQLFVTTHSGECIRAAHRVFSERDYAFRLFRLQRELDRTVSAKAFTKDAVEAALKTELELR